eukprot:SAG22_NODE_8924_length_621_cov_0.668582_1_plen_172_part_01
MCAGNPEHPVWGVQSAITAGRQPAGTCTSACGALVNAATAGACGGDNTWVPTPTSGEDGQRACEWTAKYTSLRTFKLDHSITAPPGGDGLVTAVHATRHVGDFHGHRELATVSLQNNNLKGDLPNVDDPHGDLDDDLVTYLLNHNAFGHGSCIDRSAGGCGPTDCVPETFQ